MDTTNDRKHKKDSFALALLVISVVANLVLLGILLGAMRVPWYAATGKPAKAPQYRSWSYWDPERRPSMPATPEAVDKLDAVPRFRGRLSHVLFSLKDTLTELEELKRTLKMWQSFPPCLADSYPTASGDTNVPLVFYFDSAPRRRTVKLVKKMFSFLPTRTRLCFSHLEIRHAGLSPLRKKHSLEDERRQWQQYFGTLVTNKIGLEKVNHVLVLTSDTRPVQPNWMNVMDALTRPPNEAAWIKGSIFRGRIDGLPADIGQLIRLSTAGIYFIADAAFADFYFEAVRPWVHSQPSSTIIPEFGDRWNVDIFQYLAGEFVNRVWLKVSHQFRHTDIIGDYYGRNVSLGLLHREHPDMVLVTGNIVLST